MYSQKTYTLTDIVNKAVNWFNKLTPNQLVVLTILGVLILAENAPKNNFNYYYSKPKSIPRKNFSDNTKKLAKFGQGQVCDECKNYTEFWEFHHKDGNRSNNRLENCQGLCPNCHAKIHRKNNFSF